MGNYVENVKVNMYNKTAAIQSLYFYLGRLYAE